MGKVEQLASRYEQHICVPWPRTVAGAQRVVMVIYEKELERTLRARIEEFEQRPRAAGHGWIEFDCTSRFAEWLAADEYREAYFEDPRDLGLKLEAEFQDHVTEPLRQTLREASDQDVVALTGVSALYGFLQISQLVRGVEPDIRGRLVVFFPGTKSGNNLRLMDARDGWNYLASSISLHESGVPE